MSEIEFPFKGTPGQFQAVSLAFFDQNESEQLRHHRRDFGVVLPSQSPYGRMLPDLLREKAHDSNRAGVTIYQKTSGSGMPEIWCDVVALINPDKQTSQVSVRMERGEWERVAGRVRSLIEHLQARRWIEQTSSDKESKTSGRLEMLREITQQAENERAAELFRWNKEMEEVQRRIAQKMLANETTERRGEQSAPLQTSQQAISLPDSEPLERQAEVKPPRRFGWPKKKPLKCNQWLAEQFFEHGRRDLGELREEWQRIRKEKDCARDILNPIASMRAFINEERERKGL